MTTINNIVNKIKSYFAPKINDNITKSRHEIDKIGKDNLIFSINEIENKFTLLKKTKKNIEVYHIWATNNYNFLLIYIQNPKDTEILNFCKKETERLLEIGKFMHKLFALLETLDFRLTEKLNLVKNYDFDNENNEEINEKLKILTIKINNEFEILEKMESYLDYVKEYELWQQSIVMMPEVYKLWEDTKNL